MKFAMAIMIYGLICASDVLALIIFDEDTKEGEIARLIGISLFCIALGFLVSRGVISIICDLI